MNATTPANPHPTEPLLPQRVGVLGGGRMGAGIAHAFLTRGSNVLVVERDAEAARGALERVRNSVVRSAQRGAVEDSVEETMSRCSVSTTRSDFADRNLIIEAVPEDLDLKIAALTDVEGYLPEGAHLATNTSSLSITKIATALRRPEHFFGMHFFNPVPASTLIELVLSDSTSDAAARRAVTWIESLGKTAVVVRDAPGFASSRLGVAIALEAMRMVEEGVASARDIDNAMVLGYRHPTGPLRTTDIVGLDVRLGIAEYLQATLGDRFTPPQILRDMVSSGNLGQKTGQGFYDWH